MMKGKYLVIDDTLAVLLPKAMPHDRIREMNITSAGFFSVYEETDGKLNVMTYGESESLSLKSKPHDAALIKAFYEMNESTGMVSSR